jgi:hypothetical protein
VLLDRDTLAAIARGDVSLAFRRWRRPTVRTGGTLLTAKGQLQIGAVDVINPDAVSEAEAQRAGFDSRDELLRELNRKSEGEIYRIELRGLGPDPRIALRESAAFDEKQIAELRRRLDRLDAASPDGPWTLKTVQAIHDHPGLRAGDLCRHVGQERIRFKPNVRKLKTLGLTISLEVGYRSLREARGGCARVRQHSARTAAREARARFSAPALPRRQPASIGRCTRTLRRAPRTSEARHGPDLPAPAECARLRDYLAERHRRGEIHRNRRPRAVGHHPGRRSQQPRAPLSSRRARRRDQSLGLCRIQVLAPVFHGRAVDQRGSGRTLGKNGLSSASTISIDRMTKDGIELAESLRTALGNRRSSYWDIMGLDSRRPDGEGAAGALLRVRGDRPGCRSDPELRRCI